MNLPRWTSRRILKFHRYSSSAYPFLKTVIQITFSPNLPSQTINAQRSTLSFRLRYQRNPPLLNQTASIYVFYLQICASHKRMPPILILHNQQFPILVPSQNQTKQLSLDVHQLPPFQLSLIVAGVVTSQLTVFFLLSYHPLELAPRHLNSFAKDL